jgi:membrane protein implicated in regulation of membrane protease activity
MGYVCGGSYKLSMPLTICVIEKRKMHPSTFTRNSAIILATMDMLLKFIPSPWFWFALTVLFVLIEAATWGLTTIWFAIAALVMTFLSFLPIPLTVQVLVFLGIAIALLVFTRPIAIKKFKVGREKTNLDSLIGQRALVTKAISEFERGEIKLNGQFWSAHAENNGAIAEGSKCEILRIEGVQAIVKAVDCYQSV